MFVNRAALVALSGFTLVSAQANSNSTFKIDPSQVDPLDQSTWCGAQTDSCNTLCGSVLVNNCSPTTLDFECECAGQAFPDMNKFENTMPWFVCMRLQDNCIVANQNDAAGQKNCTATFKDNCGTESVQDHQGQGAVLPTTSSSAPASTQPAATASAAATSSTSSGAASAPTAHMRHFGNGAAAAAIGLLAYAL
ncbi:hypothetical protein GGR50DRAFT_662320 [Xylaria sp. CBS 124048]|nr:hypothetical protein GGR50DRAFT_662320 [Xylaria sp. CBS 124048]